MGGRRQLAVVVGAALIMCCAATTAPAAPAAVHLRAAFDRDARLGGTSAISLDLRVFARRAPSPMTELTVLAPRGIDFGTSGLGLATCQPAARDLLTVLARGHDLRSCPANAVLGRGNATAAIHYSPQQTVAADGTVTLYNGPPVGDAPGVVAYVLTAHPIRSQLVYTGELFQATAPFGLGIRLGLPAIPDSPFGAPISLGHLKFDLGGEDVVYFELNKQGRRVRYHPGGLAIPANCPRGGFRFRATVRFADGSARSGGTATPCPPARR
ncbi:MAG: hypothetical protein ABW167_07310 [Baekduia sp.]